jgi:phage gp46-like protein
MLKLVQTDWGRFELAFDDPAAADADAAVATLVYAALATDGEAPEHREADRYQRRGWWADKAAGAGLWHVRRQALSAEARAETLAMIRRALAKADPALTDITVEEVPAAANVSSLVVQVAGRHHGRQFLLKVPL